MRTITNYYALFRKLAFTAVLAVATVRPATAQTVVNAGDAYTFSVPAAFANYAWRLDGTQVSTNGIVGTNGPTFTYAPGRFDVGVHELTCYTTTNGTTTSAAWAVRVRIPLPTPTTSYYVATNGSDSNAGTYAAPYLTLERARNAIRTNGVPAGGVTVWLMGGTYYRTNTFLLTNIDSGTLTSPVIYASYPGQTAVISEGKLIPASSFVPLNPSQTNRLAAGVNPTNIWELDLASAGITHTGPFPAQFNTWVTTNVYGTPGSGGQSSGGIGEFFYNGQRMWLSRYPAVNQTNNNLGTTFLQMDGVATTGAGSTNYLNYPGIYTNSAGQGVPVGCAFHYYSSNATEVARWQSALTNGGVWVSGFWRVNWQNDAMQILAVDQTNQVIEITNLVSVSGGIGSKYSQPQGSFTEPFWVMNLLEDMTQANTWALDFKRGKLYFYPPGPLTNTIEVSDNSSPMVVLNGTTNVVFQGVTFTEGLGQGVLVTNGVNNLIAGCTLENLNNYPVEIDGGFTNGVESCLLENLGGGGVFLRGGNETATPRIPGRDFVVNNVITNAGVVARIYATPIDAGFGGEVGGSGGGGHTECVGMRVAHNLIGVCPHVGILHGSWDNLFEYNNLVNDGQTWNGISVVYSYDQFGRCGNDDIRYNFIHDSAQDGALGFDGDHWDEHIYGNIANNTPAGLGTGTGTEAQAGHEQAADFYNNLTVNNYQPYGGLAFCCPTPSVIEENAAVDCVYPYVWDLVTVGVSSNTITTSTAAVMESGPNLTYTNDPGFINFSNEDFRLVPGAQIYTDMPQFATIPFELIGLYNDEIWSNATVYAPYVTASAASEIGPGAATLNGTLVYPMFGTNTAVFFAGGAVMGGPTSGLGRMWRRSDGRRRGLVVRT